MDCGQKGVFRRYSIPAFYISSGYKFGTLSLCSSFLEFREYFTDQEFQIQTANIEQIQVLSDQFNADFAIQALSVQSYQLDDQNPFVLESGADNSAGLKAISIDAMNFLTVNGDYSDFFRKLIEKAQQLAIIQSGKQICFITFDLFLQSFVRELIKFCIGINDFSTIQAIALNENLVTDTLCFLPQQSFSDVFLLKEDADGLFIRQCLLFQGDYHWCDFFSCESVACTNQAVKTCPQVQDRVLYFDIAFPLTGSITGNLVTRGDILLMRSGSLLSRQLFNKQLLKILKQLQYDIQESSETMSRIQSLCCIDGKESGILQYDELHSLKQELQLEGIYKLMFTSSTDGHYLPNLYAALASNKNSVSFVDNNCQNNEQLTFANESFMVLCESDSEQVFGFVGNWFLTPNCSDYEHSALFKVINKQISIFYPQKRKNFYCFAKKDHLAMGSPKFAIYIDRMLETAITNIAEDFENDYLFNGEDNFNGRTCKLKCIEVFRFV